MSESINNQRWKVSGQQPLIFPFPYPTPYPIQHDFMIALYQVLNQGSVGIFQSPTGTGKSLSILCGGLKWLRDHQSRSEEAQVQDLLLSTSGSSKVSLADTSTIRTNEKNVPDWIKLHAASKAREAALEQVRRRRAQSEAARQKRQQLRKLMTTSRPRYDTSIKGKEHIKEINAKAEMSHFGEEGEMALKRIKTDERAFFSAVDANDSDCSHSSGGQSEGDGEDEVEPVQIYYASRTHSQLSQFAAELKKTSYAQDIKMIALGSRKNLCIHPRVSKLKSVQQMNDACLDLKESESSKCPFLPADRRQTRRFAETLTSQILDIEELHTLGSNHRQCPYYASRSAIRQAELILLPYNLLLLPSARESLGIDLRGRVVIFDEAHNLIDALTAMHSVSLNLDYLVQGYAEVSSYLDRYGDRLLGQNIVYIKQILNIIQVLVKILDPAADIVGLSNMMFSKKASVPLVAEDFCEDSTSSTAPKPSSSIEEKATIKSVVDFLHENNLDHVNFLQIQAYLERSKLCKKVLGFSKLPMNKENDEGTGDAGISRHQAALQYVQSFLVPLAASSNDGRVIITPKTGFKYLLLNPTEVFREIAEEARSVILAGGTMDPMSSFDSLFNNRTISDLRDAPALEKTVRDLERKDIVHFSCGHIIPPTSLKAVVFSKGPTGIPLNYSHSLKSNVELINETGRIIFNFCRLIPAGIVVFFPSYAYMNEVISHWRRSGQLQKLESRKHIFQEPVESGAVESILKSYEQCIHSHKQQSQTGAMLFCVVGGKMSEGINFSDDMGRAVIMISLPYPNRTSVELQERIAFAAQQNPTNLQAGPDYYLNMCMRAVNQCIGRAIRHGGDYSCILLLDERYSQTRVQEALPRWIRDCGISGGIGIGFGPLVAEISSFFASKKGLRVV